MIKGLEIPISPIISCDPGWHTAIAIVNGADVLHTAIANCPKKLSGQRMEQMEYMRQEFKKMLDWACLLHQPELILLEGVQIYSNSVKSQVAAFRGDTVALATLVGVYVSEAKAYCENVKIVLPREWRGSMKDEVVVNRVRRATGKDFPEHVSDAVGIGLSAFGKL